MEGLVLSLFPGADLLGRAFEEEGFCVVRGPDILWGGDVCDFHAQPGRFDGIIGGPPCQPFSCAARSGSDAIDLIGEFVRIVKEASPQWAVMENVMLARHSKHFPDWQYSVIRDWDCGGHTYRRRMFAVYGLPVIPLANKRQGTPRYSVLASHWDNRNPSDPKLYERQRQRTPGEAAYLQGFKGLHLKIMQAQPGNGDTGYTGVSMASRRVLAIHMLGNGVPHAMGLYVARHVKRCIKGEYDPLIGMPMQRFLTSED